MATMTRLRSLLPLTILAAAVTLAERPVEGAGADDLRPVREAEVSVPKIRYERDVLDNGLVVLYAPMDNAPVVHVRLLYRVGSKDEIPDRQGFAHLFEHMMFRGSANVPSEEHMRLVNSVGGNSNAFTSFDQTTYINTVPSNALEMVLWLEADRMASFKVDAEKFVTERSVVNEEYLQRVANPPYGRLFMDFFALAYEEHHYRWTPIGDMDQLAEASVEELQEFFDTFYVPENAVLAIVGKFEIDEARQWVESYFGWIERGEEVPRRSPEEPEQREARRKLVQAPTIPLPRILMGFKTTTYPEEDQEVLEVLANIVGQGRSSRLYQRLVGDEAGVGAVANMVSAGNQRLQDVGMFMVTVGVLPEADPEQAEEAALEVLREVAEQGVRQEELEKARTQLRVQMLNSRQTASSVAGLLAEAEAFGGDAELVNTTAERIAAVTAEDVQRVARQYLAERRMSVLHYRPGRAEPGQAAEDIQAMERAAEAIEAARRIEEDPAPADAADPTRAAIEARLIDFPDDYPTEPPVPDEVIDASFDMGEPVRVGEMEVIVIRDDRLPLVGMTLLLPAGGDAVPPGSEGLASLTADLLTRGAGEMNAAEFSEALDTRGINIGVSDGGDHTRLTGSFPREMIEDTRELLHALLTSPRLEEREFEPLRLRMLAGLQQALSNPTGVSSREMQEALFEDHPAGRNATLDSLRGVTLEDVGRWYRSVYRPQGATLILAGDLDEEAARRFAEELQRGWPSPDADPPVPDYTLPKVERRIILVDNPGGGQSAIRIAGRSFTNDTEEKYAGSVAGVILAGGLESRLNRVLRVEQGLTYGASGRFDPGRHVGSFQVSFSTRPETTAQAIRSTFEVLERMGREPVEAEELSEAQRRVAGSLVMSTQTVSQLAQLRSTIVLNGYPLDYFDDYAEKIAAVTVEDVREVMSRYADPERLTIVVVGPAAVIREQLEEFGEVEVRAMPLRR